MLNFSHSISVFNLYVFHILVKCIPKFMYVCVCVCGIFLLLKGTLKFQSLIFHFITIET